MGGKSQPSTTTQITKNEPLPEQRPYLTSIWQDAANARKSGDPQYFPDSTVIDWSQPTYDSWHSQEAMARDPRYSTGLFTAQNALTNVLNSQTPATASGTWESLQNASALGSNPFLSNFSGMANGSRDFTDTGFYQQAKNWVNPGVAATQAAMAKIGQGSQIDQLGKGGSYTNAALAGQTAQANDLATRTNEGTRYLRDTADGKYLEAGNPYLTDYMTQVLAPIQDQLKTATARDASAFNQSGRTNGGAFASRINSTDKTYQDAMTKAVTDISFQNWNQERDRQIAAQQAIGNFDRSDVDAARGAWSDLSGTSSAQQGLRNSALSAAEGLRQGADSLRLTGANQLGNQAVAQQTQRMGAAEALRNQWNMDTQTRSSSAQLGATTHNNDVQSRLQQDQLRLAAANAQAGDAVTRGNQVIAASQAAGSVYDNLFKPIDRLKEAGAAQEQQAGAYLQDRINRHNAAENATWDNLQRELSMHQGLGYGTGTSQTTQPVYSNKGAQALGTAASIAGALAKCDRRLKTDIVRIGATDSGLPLYAFRYIETGEWAFGPMADEVEAVAPDAVAMLPDAVHKGVHVPNLISHELAEAA